MKTAAIIQARMGSTRLPGKVLNRLCGRTVLGHVITRVQAARRLDQVIVATTTAGADDAVVAECARYGVPCVRGSEQDVLARYHQAAHTFGVERIVRVTSDCPLFDPELLDRMLAEYDRLLSAGIPVDYLSNTLERTFPRGLDAEIFPVTALDRAHQEATQPYEREHVTPYIHEHPQHFALHSFTQPEDHSALRWTLDTEADLCLVRRVYRELYRDDRLFTTDEVLRLLAAHPELARLNAEVRQKPLQS